MEKRSEPLHQVRGLGRDRRHLQVLVGRLKVGRLKGHAVPDMPGLSVHL